MDIQEVIALIEAARTKAQNSLILKTNSEAKIYSAESLMQTRAATLTWVLNLLNNCDYGEIALGKTSDLE